MRMNLSFFTRITTGMCLAFCFTACETEYLVYPMTAMGYVFSDIPSLDMPYVFGNTRAIDENIRVTCRKAVEERLSISSSVRRVSVH